MEYRGVQLVIYSEIIIYYALGVLGFVCVYVLGCVYVYV